MKRILIVFLALVAFGCLNCECNVGEDSNGCNAKERFFTGHGDGQYDKMTYLHFYSEINLTPYENMTVNEIRPEFWYGNGDCFYEFAIYDESDNELASGYWQGFGYSDYEGTIGAEIPFAQIKLYAENHYRIYQHAWTSMSVGIYTAGSDNPKITETGEYQIISIDAMSDDPDIILRGPIAFSLYLNNCD